MVNKMFNEEQLEDATLNIFEELGYERLNGYNIDRDYHSVFMDDCLFDDLCKINKDFNDSQIQEAIKTIKTLSHGNPIEDNKTFTRYLLECVPVQVKTNTGYQYKNVKLVDFDKFAQKETETLCNHIDNYIKNNNVETIYLNSGKIDKNEIIMNELEKNPNKTG